MPATRYPCGCIEFKTRETYFCHRVLGPYKDLLEDVVRQDGYVEDEDEYEKKLLELYRFLNNIGEQPEDDTFLIVKLNWRPFDQGLYDPPEDCEYLLIDLEDSTNSNMCRNREHGVTDEQAELLETCFYRAQELFLIAERWKQFKRERERRQLVELAAQRERLLRLTE